MEKDLKTEYGLFISESEGVDFDTNAVPTNLRHLIPYAKFWGISDDLERERLTEKAPEHIKESLQKLIRENDDFLDNWLAGEEASHPDPSDAYVAFSAMRMAADFM